jgi:hypothetical protein
MQESSLQSSPYKPFNETYYFQASQIAIYSVLVVDLATTGVNVVFQLTAHPPIVNTYITYEGYSLIQIGSEI